MIRTAALAISVLLGLSAAPAMAQAFGISMGDDVADLQVVRDRGGGSYVVDVVAPHAEFEAYTVKAAPSTGVCQVVAIGRDHANDRYGGSVKKRFHELSAALSEKYGPVDLFDHVRSGALWKDADEWVMAIRQNERDLQGVWVPSNGADMGDVSEILLTVAATSSSTAYLHLQYRFTNHDACAKELASDQNSVL